MNPVKLVLDFGHATGETHVNISNIVLKNHADDDGTVLPQEEQEGNGGNEPTLDWDPSVASNLWTPVENGDAFISVTPWFANDGWSQIGDPEWSHIGNEWTVTIPDGMGGSQWQGQFPINTTIATAQADAYNFSCTILADNDANGITIKLTETDDETKHDDNFYFADRHNVKADEPYVYKAMGVTLPKNDAHALSLFFDFGGTPVGTNITISNIIFEKAQ